MGCKTGSGRGNCEAYNSDDLLQCASRVLAEERCRVAIGGRFFIRAQTGVCVCGRGGVAGYATDSHPNADSVHGCYTYTVTAIQPGGLCTWPYDICRGRTKCVSMNRTDWPYVPRGNTELGRCVGGVPPGSIRKIRGPTSYSCPDTNLLGTVYSANSYSTKWMAGDAEFASRRWHGKQIPAAWTQSWHSLAEICMGLLRRAVVGCQSGQGPCPNCAPNAVVVVKHYHDSRTSQQRRAEPRSSTLEKLIYCYCFPRGGSECENQQLDHKRTATAYIRYPYRFEACEATGKSTNAQCPINPDHTGSRCKNGMCNPCYASMVRVGKGCGCLPGKFFNRTSRTCGQCPRNTYKSENNVANISDSMEDQCSSCDTYTMNSTTSDDGQTDRRFCECPQHTSRVDCAVGHTCRRTGAKYICVGCYDNPQVSVEVWRKTHGPSKCSLDRIRVSFGYWRDAQARSLKIMKCLSDIACLGGPGNNTCYRGHMGPLCSVCKHDYTLVKNTCLPCKSDDVATQLVLLMIACILLLMVLAFCVYKKYVVEKAHDECDAPPDEYITVGEINDNHSKGLDKTTEIELITKLNLEVDETVHRPEECIQPVAAETDDNDSGEFGEAAEVEVVAESDNEDEGKESLFAIIKRKYKVTVSFYQVATAIPAYYPIEFPVTFNAILATFSIVNLDILKIVPVNCFGSVDYYDKYMGRALAPVVVSAIMYAATVIKPDKQKMIWKIYFLFLFTIYPKMCSAGGETFRCLKTGTREPPRGTNEQLPELSYLKYDLSKSCTTDIHIRFQDIDRFFALLYPIGIPAFFFYHLWNERELLISRQYEWVIPEEAKYCGAICQSYEPRCWWWEIFECFRKYFQVSVPIMLFGAGEIHYEASQILFGLLASMVYMAAFQYYAPYIDPIDDVQAYGGHSTIVLIFILGAYLYFGNRIVALNKAIKGDTSEGTWSSSARANVTKIWGVQLVVGIVCGLILLVVVVGFATGVYAVLHRDDETGEDDRAADEIMDCIDENWRTIDMGRLKILLSSKMNILEASASTNEKGIDSDVTDDTSSASTIEVGCTVMDGTADFNDDSEGEQEGTDQTRRINVKLVKTPEDGEDTNTQAHDLEGIDLGKPVKM